MTGPITCTICGESGLSSVGYGAKYQHNILNCVPKMIAERDRLKVVIEGLVGALEDMTDRFESALEATHATRIDRQEIRAARILITEARK